jgi:hypothetical protein
MYCASWQPSHAEFQLSGFDARAAKAALVISAARKSSPIVRHNSNSGVQCANNCHRAPASEHQPVPLRTSEPAFGQHALLASGQDNGLRSRFGLTMHLGVNRPQAGIHIVMLLEDGDGQLTRNASVRGSICNGMVCQHNARTAQASRIDCGVLHQTSRAHGLFRRHARTCSCRRPQGACRNNHVQCFS